MIRYLSCSHDNADAQLTDEERELFIAGRLCITSDKGITRTEETKSVKYEGQYQIAYGSRA
jgi:hypothetical protein